MIASLQSYCYRYLTSAHMTWPTRLAAYFRYGFHNVMCRDPESLRLTTGRMLQTWRCQHLRW